MTAQIILLSGPPAVGKDTVTAALAASDPRFRLFEKLKLGGGRSDGYRMIDVREYQRMLDAGDVLQSNERYGNLYAVDRPRLQELLSAGAIPVIHVGRRTNPPALREAAGHRQVLSVLLWAARDVLRTRLRERQADDIPERLKAYDQELKELKASCPDADFDIMIRTDQVTVQAVVKRIQAAVSGRPLPTDAGAIFTGMTEP